MVILTEENNPNTVDIDLLSTRELVQRINEEDKKVAFAIEKELDAIAKAIDLIVAQFQQWGRLMYFWAWSSGRLGVLDASECPPTFSVDSSLVQGFIAWGDSAIRKTKAWAEDSYEFGQQDAENLCEKDVAVLISASGNPKYLRGVLEKAREKNAKIIGLTCNPQGYFCDKVDILICPQVGAEVIAWSSRMKAWTAQKMVLEMLTTGAMIKRGKTYHNLMVDLNVSNEKLKKRAISLIVRIAGVQETEAETALENCHGKVKTAIVSLMKHLSPNESEQLLEQHQGILRKVIG